MKVMCKYARGLFLWKIFRCIVISRPVQGRYIHRGRRTCPHRKIYIYPQIHGTCCIATDVRYKAGRDQRSASFKRIRQNHHHSRNKIYSQRSSSHHSRRRSAGKDPPDRQCGFSGKGASGQTEDGKERMVKTPWFEQAIPFREAARIGTQKVIQEHSTIGIVVTTDGSFGELPRDNFSEAEEKAIQELKNSRNHLSCW